MADVIGGIVADLQATDNLSPAFAKARQAMDALGVEARRLKEDQKAGIITSADLAAKIALLSAEYNRLGAAMAAAAPRLNAVDSALGSAAGKSGAFARGMLDVSRGVEDFATGGFLGVLNNIPGVFTNMATAAGVSATAVAGWTTGISLAATGAYVLYRNWDSIEALWAGGETLTEAQRMEELGKQTSRTADEQERLNRYKREQKTIEEQGNRRPKQEGEIGAEVGKEVGEVGAGELRARIRRRMLADMGPVTEEEITRRAKKIDALLGSMASPQDPANSTGGRLRDKAAAQLRLEREKLVHDEADKLLANAETGPGKLGEEARRRLGEMVPGPDGDIFRDPTREAGREATFEGRQAEAEHNKKAAKERLDVTGDEARHAAEEEAMAEANRARNFANAGPPDAFGSTPAAEALAAFRDAERERDAYLAEARATPGGHFTSEQQARVNELDERARQLRAAAVHAAKVAERAGEGEARATPGMLEGIHRGGEKAREEQDAAARAGDQATEDAFARVKEMQGQDAIREEMNDDKTDQFRRMRRIGERLARANFEAIRSSQVLGTASLTASVQSSITNDNPLKRMLEEAKQSNLNLAQIRQIIDRFNQPVQRGGK